MALKDNQHNEIQGFVSDIRSTVTLLNNYNSGNPEVDKLAAIMADSLNKLVCIANIHYGELIQIGNMIYDV